MRYLIYKHTFKNTGKSYIGVTRHSMERRLNGHLRESKCGSTGHFHRALRKYGVLHLESTVLEQNLSREEAFSKEIDYIKKYDTVKTGYNMTPGGDRGPICIGSLNGMFGKKHSEEAKNAMSEKKKLLVGDKHPHYGQPSPLRGKSYEEQFGKEKADRLKKERSEKLTGIKRPYNSGENSHTKRPEVKQKISEANSHPVTLNGTTYKSKRDACKQLGISLYKLNKQLGAKEE